MLILLDNRILINILVIKYQHATFPIKINEYLEKEKIKINRDVHQGDNRSPKLFTLPLENVLGKRKGTNINYLSHLRFDHDIVLISINVHELRAMLE